MSAPKMVLPEGPIQSFIADPAWNFKTFSSKGEGRSASQHYDVMTLDDIKAMPVADIAAKDSVMFLWATSPMLKQGIEVLEHWGFEYKSSMVWDKCLIGNGYWCRNQHEYVLIGRRGKHPAPAPKFRRSSVIRQVRGKHSEKPNDVHQYVDMAFPDDTKAELFARRPYPGWWCCGNELPDGMTSPDYQPKFEDTPLGATADG